MSAARRTALIAAVTAAVIAALALMLALACLTVFLGVLCAAQFLDHTPPHLVPAALAVAAMVWLGGLLAPLARSAEAECEHSSS